MSHTADYCLIQLGIGVEYVVWVVMKDIALFNHGGRSWNASQHYNDVIMGAIASQITSLTIVYSTVYSDADQGKHQSPAPLAFVRGIRREFPAQMASNVENVSIWWRHHGSTDTRLFVENLHPSQRNQQNSALLSLCCANPRAMDAFCVQRAIHDAPWRFCCKPEPAIKEIVPKIHAHIDHII